MKTLTRLNVVKTMIAVAAFGVVVAEGIVKPKKAEAFGIGIPFCVKSSDTKTDIIKDPKLGAFRMLTRLEETRCYVYTGIMEELGTTTTRKTVLMVERVKGNKVNVGDIQ